MFKKIIATVIVGFSMVSGTAMAQETPFSYQSIKNAVKATGEGLKEVNDTVSKAYRGSIVETGVVSTESRFKDFQKSVGKSYKGSDLESFVKDTNSKAKDLKKTFTNAMK